MKGIKKSLSFMLSIALALGSLIVLPATASAAFPEVINYQGKLTGTTGSPVADGVYHMRIKLYTASSGGTPIFVEDRSNALGNRVTVTSGVFSTLLGSSSSLTSLDFDQSLYLEVEVGGTASSSWETLSPRKLLGAVPVALLARGLTGSFSLNAATGTVTSLLTTNSTNTNSTSTNFFSTNSSTTNSTTTFAYISRLTADIVNFVTSSFTNLLVTGSTTLQNVTLANSTSSNSTSTNFYTNNLNTAAATVGSLNGVVYGANGVLNAVATSSLGVITTDVAEGNNLYYTSARSTTSVSSLIAGTTTTALAEGNNLYYTSARATTAVSALIAATTTTALAEGNNLYYTSARATSSFISLLAATTSINSVTTLINLASVGALNSGSITSGFGSIDIGSDSLTAGTTTLGNATTTTIYSTTASSTNLYSTNFNLATGTIGKLYANRISSDNSSSTALSSVNIDVITIQGLNSGIAYATSTNSFSTTASSTNLYSTNLNAGTSNLGTTTATTLNSGTASINTLTIGTATTTSINANSASVGTLTSGLSTSTAVNAITLNAATSALGRLTVTDLATSTFGGGITSVLGVIASYLSTAGQVLGDTLGLTNSSATISNLTTNGSLAVSSNGTGALTLDSGTTGAVNLGTGGNAKTVTIGNTTGGSALVFSSGANTSGGGTIINVPDFLANAFRVRNNSGNNFLSISTTDGSAGMEFGNNSTTTSFSFLGSGTLAVAGKLNVTGTTTLSNVIDMSSNRITNLANPTSANDAASKTYVDSLIASNLAWLEAVISISTTSAPGSPATGDRYLLGVGNSGFGSCVADNIAEYNGSSWACTTAATGSSVFVDSWINTQYTYNGSSWVTIGSTVSHNSTTGLQGGTASEYYHLNNTDYTNLTAAQAQLANLKTNTTPTFTGLILSSAGAATIKIDDGSFSAPAYTFSSDLDTGIYRIGSNSLGFTAGGLLGLTLTDTGLSVSTATISTLTSTNNTLTLATITGATTTNIYSARASSTEFFSTTATLGSTTLGLLYMPETIATSTIMGPIGFGSSTPSARFVFQQNIADSTFGSGRLFSVANASGTDRLTILNNGRFGIGSSSPSTTFGLTGSAYITSALGVGVLNTTAGTIKANVSFDTSDNTGQYKIGGSQVIQFGSNTSDYYFGSSGNQTSTGGNNQCFGINSCLSMSSGQGNIAMGRDAFYSNTTGSYNVALGYNAMKYSTTSGSNNVAIGNLALVGTVSVGNTGSSNVAVGQSALSSNTSGSSNIAVGQSALSSNTSGLFNTAVGIGALQSLSSGQYNVAVGNSALNLANSGNYNVAVGVETNQFNKSATNTTVIGVEAAKGTSGVSYSRDTAIVGYRAGFSLTTGDYSTILGSQAGQSITSGTNNTIVGYQAGLAINTSSGNTLIGSTANVGNSSISYSTAIGVGSTVSCSSCMVLGGTSGEGNINVGIGTTTPYAKLTIQGGSTATSTLAIVPTPNQTANILDIYDTSATPVITSVINSSGNWGIGTTSPSARFSVKGTGTGTGRAFAISNSSDAEKFTVLDNGSLTLGGYGAGTLMTDASGNVTASSDERLKDIKSSFTRGLEAIQAISPITYRWNVASGLDRNNDYTGFSAQNVQAAIPEAIFTDSRGMLSLSDRPIMAALVNAVKEQQAQILAIASSSGQNTFNIENWLAGFGVEITNSFAKFRKVIAEAFTVGSTEKPAGITIYDEVTRQPFCMKVSQGTMMSTSGECNNTTWYAPTLPQATEAQATPSVESTATSTEHVSTSTPATTPTVESTATSTPSVEAPAVVPAPAEPAPTTPTPTPEVPAAPAESTPAPTEPTTPAEPAPAPVTP